LTVKFSGEGVLIDGSP